MNYHPLTRLLHLLLAAGVVSQMLTSLVMVTPKPGRVQNLFYEVHETVGIGVLAMVSLYWLWVLARALTGGDAAALFPWLSRRRLFDLRNDAIDTLKELVRFRLPSSGSPRPLPSAVQGIGLLLAVALAGTGTAIAIGTGPDGRLSPLLHAVKEVHESFAPLMWAYIIAHPLLGFLHQLAGHRSLNRMFSPR